MTDATYSWPRPSLFPNSDFEAPGGTTNFTTWTEVGTVTNVVGQGSTEAAGLAQGASVWQEQVFIDATAGRWVDQTDDLLLTVYLKSISGTTDNTKVQLFLTDGTDLKYSYDFMNGKWVASPSTSDMDQGKSWAINLTETSYTQFPMPKVYAPAEAGEGTDLDDGAWTLRVRVWNDSSTTGVVGVDDVLLTRYTGNVQAVGIGSYVVCWNGVSYPVKYDLRSDTVTELSVNRPYETDNSALPGDSSNSTGGEIPDSHYVGYAYTFLNDDTGEESALPLVSAQSSAYFTARAGAGGSDTNTIVLDFSTIEVPNSEDARSTDNTGELQTIVVYRTYSFAAESDAQTALELQDLFYEGEVVVNGTFTSTLKNEDLIKQGSLTGMIPVPTRMSAPQFQVGTLFRSRMWVAPHKGYRYGRATFTNNSTQVDGEDGTASVPATNWGRWAEMMTIRPSSVTDYYDIDRYVYPDDDGGGSTEQVRISRAFDSPTTSNSSYEMRPRSGRVWYSEEGEPGSFSSDGYILLDGADGERVTGIGQAGRRLLACTANTTFVFDYNESPSPQTGTAVASPISRDLGCIAPQSMVNIRDTAYWLSDQGVVRSNGSTTVEVISNPLQDMFTDPDDEDYVIRNYSDHFVEAYGAHHPEEQQYLLAVRTVNAKQGCDIVLAYNYFFDTWDLLDLDCGVTGWYTAKSDDGSPVLLFSDGYGRVNKWDEGFVDGAGEVNNHGKLSGEVVSATTLGATLDTAGSLFVAADSGDFSSATKGLDGAFIRVTSASDGTVQLRRIYDNTDTTIRINEAWDTTPSAGDLWEIGTIRFRWRFKESLLGRQARIKVIKQISVYRKEESVGSLPKVLFYVDQNSVDYHTAVLGADPPRFSTSDGGRDLVRGSDAPGYTHRLEIQNDGPEAPLEVRFLEASVVVRERDAT